MLTLQRGSLLGCVAVLVFTIVVVPQTLDYHALTAAASSRCITLLLWSVAQWMPIVQWRESLEQYSWKQWQVENDDIHNTIPESFLLDIPTVAVQDHAHPHDVLNYLERMYGTSWRDRPVLFQGLWSSTQLRDNDRRLSLTGLLKENLTIPFFTDARINGAITPDGYATVSQIVHNISRGIPHKIGTQLIVQNYPELLDEIAPRELMTLLFGDNFKSKHILGVGNIFGIFPATTTVPVFVANGNVTRERLEMTTHNTTRNDDTTTGEGSTKSKRPRTHLHCEPIGNVAVQLAGSKHWTLIDPQHSVRLVPSISPDGRAFFVSWVQDLTRVPRYHVTTNAGDAVWVPTWTWHQVDYGRLEGDEMNHDNDTENTISIGGSLFHFRPLEFLLRNPLYSVLIIPAMVKELLGMSTQ